MGILNSNQDMKMAAMAVLAAAFLAGFRVCDFGPRRGGVGRALNERVAADIEGARGNRGPSGGGEADPFRAPGAYYPEPVEAPMVSEDSMLPMLVAGIGGATVFGVLGLGVFVVMGRSGSEDVEVVEGGPDAAQSDTAEGPEDGVV